MQALLKTQWMTLILTLVIVACVADRSWATSTTSGLTQANQARLNSEAEQLAAQGKYSDAATRFESLAAQASNADRDHFILKAARNAQLAGNTSKARSLVDLTGKNLKAPDNALRIVINAELALEASQPDQAIAALDQIPLPLPDELAVDALAVRAQALFAAGRPVLAVNTAVERERGLKSDNELFQNRQMIWNNLKRLASTGYDLTPPAGANRITAGWLDLGKIFASAQRDPFAFNRSLGEWRTRYPAHPGGNLLVSTSVATNAKASEEHIALLLPLSGKQQASGIAVRDGFLAALLQQPGNARPVVKVFDTNEAGAINAYQLAIQGGASIIVGPLLKEDVDAIASQQIGVMTLGLNAISGSQPPPALMFQFTLDPEEEARQVAQRAHDEGHSRAIVMTPNNDWGQRMQRAFIAELKGLGDTLVDQRSYDPAARDYVGMSKLLLASKKPPQAKALDEATGNKHPLPEARDDFDYIFLAAQTSQAKQLRPALRFVLPDTSIPIYATSDSYEPETTNNSDLNGLRFVDMPWVINRDDATAKLHDTIDAIWSVGLRNRSRLYAFGIDAFNLVSWLKTPQPQLASPLRGVTGWLALDQMGRVRRQADWAQIVSGKPQPLPDAISR